MNYDENYFKNIRKNIFLTAYSGGKGHLASAYSLVEILHVLYTEKVMNYDASDPDMIDRDRLILSKGHGSLALYNTLSLNGYFPKEMLWTFCQPGTKLGGEPNALELPGIEASTGSLGHGLSIAMGMALAAKIDNKDLKVYAIVGDGECEEGTIWEAIMAAKRFKLDNLIVILDNNRIQKMGYVSDIMGVESWSDKFKAFGWDVKEADGHDVNDIKSKLTSEWEVDKPRLLVAHTVKGKGISIMENNAGWHWRMPNRRELKTFVKELDITEEELEICKNHI